MTVETSPPPLPGALPERWLAEVSTRLGTQENVRAALEVDLDGGLRFADGATLVQGVRDVGGSKQVAVVQDPDGNTIGLTHSP